MSGTGYLNRFIRLPFPEFGEDNNGNATMWVLIRNPKLIPAQELLATTTVPLDEEGKPLDMQAAGEQTYAMLAKLIIAGRVPDPAWVPELDSNGEVVNADEEAPLLPMPPTPEQAGRLPLAVVNAVAEEMKKVNPQ